MMMAEVDYTKILELADEAHTAVSFVNENPADTRFKFSCLIHVDDAADPVWQFDHQGKARDGKYPDVRNAQEYTIWQVWTVGTMEPGLITREPFDRPLKDFEYLIETVVDTVQGTVTSETTMGPT
jgi:hypothetical protein